MEGEKEAVLDRMVREGLLEEGTQELRCENQSSQLGDGHSESLLAGGTDLQRSQMGKAWLVRGTTRKPAG